MRFNMGEEKLILIETYWKHPIYKPWKGHLEGVPQPDP